MGIYLKHKKAVDHYHYDTKASKYDPKVHGAWDEVSRHDYEKATGLKADTSQAQTEDPKPE